MMANTGNRASPQWRALYEAAVLKLNRGKLLQRIAEAQHAIMDRMGDLNRSEDGSESEALMNALNALRGSSQDGRQRLPNQRMILVPYIKASAIINTSFLESNTWILPKSAARPLQPLTGQRQSDYSL